MTENKSSLANNGNPNRIDFAITLKRVDESFPELLSSLGDIGSIKNMFSLNGLMTGF